MGLVIGTDDPRASDVRALLERHLTFAREVTPPEDVFALDVDGLLDPTITFFSARLDGEVIAVGALKELDESHGELKSMHTVEGARGRGIGRAMVDHLLSVAGERGYQRLSLETGNTDDFVAARALYAAAGFAPCEPFGEYVSSGTSACMSIELEPGRVTPDRRGPRRSPSGRSRRGPGSSGGRRREP